MIAVSNHNDIALIHSRCFDVIIESLMPVKNVRRQVLDSLMATMKCDDIDINRLAQRTAGFSGAQLKHLLGYAALKAQKDGAERISKNHVDLAFDTITKG